MMTQIVDHVHAVCARPGRAPGAKVLLAAFWVGAAGLPAAAIEQGTPEERHACTPDVFRLCTEFIPDPTRITACLHQKVRDLSPACRVVMTGSLNASERRR
jgi:hypothetical protein